MSPAAGVGVLTDPEVAERQRFVFMAFLHKHLSTFPQFTSPGENTRFNSFVNKGAEQ